MEPFRADLHVHSICSDGSDSPSDLLKKAKAKGLSGLSITDHDTCNAYTPTLWEEAQDLGIRLLTGIELSSESRGFSFHILGYHYDLEKMRSFSNVIQLRRRERNHLILARLAKHGMQVSEEELEAIAPNRTIGRPHIAYLLVQKGYVETMRDAFERYLKEGASCYSPGIKFTPAEIVDQIHAANGKAVLAHPHFIRKGSLLRELYRLPLEGIECFYGNLPEPLIRPWLAAARDRKWIATGGSDYHGIYKPHIEIGASWVGEATFEALQT